MGLVWRVLLSSGNLRKPTVPEVDQDIANNKEDLTSWTVQGRRDPKGFECAPLQDNFAEKHETLKQIRDDLEQTHKVETTSQSLGVQCLGVVRCVAARWWQMQLSSVVCAGLYLVSSRDPDDFDMQTPRPLSTCSIRYRHHASV